MKQVKIVGLNIAVWVLYSLFIYLATIAIPISAQGQETGEIVLSVQDGETGHALPAFVSLSKVKMDDSTEPVTDSFQAPLGEILKSYTPGKYTVELQMEGYKSVKSWFTIGAGEKFRVSYMLYPLEKQLKGEDASIPMNMAVISGYVTDYETGNSLEGVHVVFEKKGVETYSDQTGYYEAFILTAEEESIRFNDEEIKVFHETMVFELARYKTIKEVNVIIAAGYPLEKNMAMFKGEGEVVRIAESAPLSASCTWPVDSPNPTANDYSAYNQIGNYKYHSVIDITSSLYYPWNYNTPVMAVASGTVYKIFRTPDTTTTCQGNSISAPTNSHGVGNVVIIQHSNGNYTLYGHLDCINTGIVPGKLVVSGQPLGIMGNSASVRRDNSFITPHVHFEYKDYGVVGSISDDYDGVNPTYWGYTPDPPDGYHFYDPRYISCSSFSSSTITKTPIEVTTDGLNVRTGPSTDYAVITQVNSGLKFVAFETSAFSGTWYRIYLPNSGGPTAGWVSGSLVVQQPNETQLEVINTGSTGLNVRDSAEGNILQRWDGTYNGICRGAKIWDGQRFVSLGSQSGWYNYCLPNNHYGSTCSQNVTGPNSGWSSGTYLNVIGGGGSDIISPTVAITSPTSESTYTTTSSSLNLGGTASDNVGVAQVTWSNNRGGSGTANGTTSWSVNGIVLQSGVNVITVTARDAANNTGTDIVTVTYSSSSTFIIQPGHEGNDTCYGTVYVTNGAPDAASLYMGGFNDWYYDFFLFDLTGAPSAAETVSAKLYLFGSAPNDPRFKLNKITESWTEGGVSLAHNPGSVFYKKFGSFAVGADAWNSIDITKLYKNWKNGKYPNYGVKLVPTRNNHTNGWIASSDHENSAIRPKIIVTRRVRNRGKE